MSKLPPAIIEQFRANARGAAKREAEHNWITFACAVVEVASALNNLPTEVASMTLFGLIATGDVCAGDAEGSVIDIDECTIAELGGKPTFVSARQLRDWLREHSTVPLSGERDRVIEELLRKGEVPPDTTKWKTFYDKVRDQCGGWLGKGAKRRPAPGFGDKQIYRTVKAFKDR